MKHIESILPEYAADDMTALLLSDATATAALTALLHSVTGCDIPQTSDLPESEVEELVPLCVSILRRHWQTPLTCLGDGTTPMSLSDLMRQAIGDRVQGNEAWSIPPANTNIPTAVDALRQRDMSSGLTLTLPAADADGSPTTMPLPDGLSLAQLLCGVSPDGTDIASQVTEIVDSNVGWVMKKALPWSTFPNVTKATLGMESVTNIEVAANISTLTEIELPYIKEFISNGNKGGAGWGMVRSLPITKLYLPSLETYRTDYHSSAYEGLVVACSQLEEFIAPKLSVIDAGVFYDNNSMLNNCPNLKKVVLGTLTYIKRYSDYPNTDSFINVDCPNLIHFEVGEGTCVSLRIIKFNPTSVLSDSERLPIFLSNFKTYIAERLSEQGSGLTLTLSQAVRDAIQQDPEIVSIITSKGWTISPAPSV